MITLPRLDRNSARSAAHVDQHLPPPVHGLVLCRRCMSRPDGELGRHDEPKALIPSTDSRGKICPALNSPCLDLQSSWFVNKAGLSYTLRAHKGNMVCGQTTLASPIFVSPRPLPWLGNGCESSLAVTVEKAQHSGMFCVNLAILNLPMFHANERRTTGCRQQHRNRNLLVSSTRSWGELTWKCSSAMPALRLLRSPRKHRPAPSRKLAAGS
jgi:hypothetical protein